MTAAVTPRAVKPKFVLKVLSIAVLTVVMSTVAYRAVADESQTNANGNNSPECTAFKNAAQIAMSNQLSIVDSFMNGANGQMQAAVSKSNSCIGNLALLDFDLSKLIPDFGLLGNLLTGLVDRIVSGVINRACAAISDVIRKPAAIWNSAIGSLNLNDQFQNWASDVSYKIPGVIDSPPSGGGSGSGSVISPAEGIDAGVICTDTVAGRVCSDGSSTGTGVDPSTPSGAAIGAQFGVLVRACSAALDADAVQGNGLSQASKEACSTLQNFIAQHAPYIDPNSIPRYPSFPLEIPPGTGSVVCGGGVCSAKTGGGNSVVSDNLSGGKKSSSGAGNSSNFSLPVRQ